VISPGTGAVSAPGVGEPAPDFVLPDQHGTPTRLSALRGRAAVVIFYPWAFTAVCNSELSAIRNDLETFQNERVQVLAVSCDSVPVLRMYDAHEGLGFPLLSDFWPHGVAARAYGVFDEERGCALRGTFVVDPAGILRWQVLNEIPHPRDVAEYRRVLTELAGK
jgi:peroxiredoxin